MKHPSIPPESPHFSPSVRKRLHSYALAASAAAAGAVTTVQPADARIVYTATTASLIGIGDTIPIDFNHDGIVDFKLCYYATAMFYYLCEDTESNLNAVVTTHSHNGLFAKPLNAGVRIGPRQTFGGGGFQNLAIKQSRGTSDNSGTGPWLGKANKYLGMKFVIGKTLHYGWARVSAQKECCQATLSGYAYETIPNKPIIAGKTKSGHESQGAGLGALAAGVNGLHTSR